MTQIMTDRIQYATIPAPKEHKTWVGHYVVTKCSIKGSWGELPKGTVMHVLACGYSNVFKTLPSRALDFSVEVTINATQEELLKEYIHFIEPKSFY